MDSAKRIRTFIEPFCRNKNEFKVIISSVVEDEKGNIKILGIDSYSDICDGLQYYFTKLVNISNKIPHELSIERNYGGSAYANFIYNRIKKFIPHIQLQDECYTSKESLSQAIIKLQKTIAEKSLHISDFFTTNFSKQIVSDFDNELKSIDVNTSVTDMKEKYPLLKSVMILL
jgi:hypothetical protein